MVKTCQDCIHLETCGIRTAFDIKRPSSFNHTDNERKLGLKLIIAAKNGLANACHHYREETTDGNSRRTSSKARRRETLQEIVFKGEAIRGITFEEAKAQTGISFLHEMRDINTGSYTGKEGVCEVRRIIDGNLVTDHFRRSPKAQTKAKISDW